MSTPPLPEQPFSSNPPVSPQYGMHDSEQERRDAEHLKILTICYYIFGALNALGGCAGLLYVGMGIMFAAGGETIAQSDPSMSKADKDAMMAMGWMFTGIGGCVVVLSLALAVLAFMTAANLPKYRKRTLCMIEAGISCLSIPLGTILGVFTFIVMARPTVKARFEAEARRVM